jgi:type I restriction enzyme S subunit
VTSSPAGWKEVRLGDLGPLSKGVGIRKNEVTPYGIPCVRYGQIYTEYSFVIGEIQTFVSPQVASNSRPLRKGEILFAGSGETKEDIGKCIAYVEDVGAVAGGDIVILTPEGADSRFLGYLLNSPNVAKQKTSRAQGDAVVHISAANLASIVLDLPPLMEQEAIAEALSDADAAIESLDALIVKKRDVKQATMQQLLTGRTRLPGFTADWNEVRLGSFISLRTGKLDVNAGSPDGVFPFFTCSQETLRINHAEFSGKSVIVAGNGDLGVKFFDGEFNAYQRTYILQSLDERNLDVSFLYAYMLRYVESLRKATQGSTIQYLKKQQFTEARLPLPVLGEQQAIAEALSAMDDELEVLTEQAFKLRMVKQGMMQDLLTGKVRLV